MINLDSIKVAVIGLGYVGLPLALAFGKIRETKGFDINVKRINELSKGLDFTNEVTVNDFHDAQYVRFTSDIEEIRSSNCFIITVPTPIDKDKKPDLKPLFHATKAIGKILKKEDIVIYESTVYPGVTEEECVPILEKESGLSFNKDFYCGYSPERINPGDKQHKLSDIKKIVSSSSDKIEKVVFDLYSEIIHAGVFLAESIKVAEAAKVIENTQRDLNIALINELAIIFNKLDIDTKSVLQAAGTKWNFLPFWPGLVGGHCIGVDPYYLTYKSQLLGYEPEIILAGRKMNDGMSYYVASELIKSMIKKSFTLEKSRVLILGFTFKENCPDIRNSKVFDLYLELKSFGLGVDVYDPIADHGEVSVEYDIKLLDEIQTSQYEAIVIAVAHDNFKKMSSESFKSFGKKDCIIYDLKYVLKDRKNIKRL